MSRFLVYYAGLGFSALYWFAWDGVHRTCTLCSVCCWWLLLRCSAGVVSCGCFCGLFSHLWFSLLLWDGVSCVEVYKGCIMLYSIPLAFQRPFSPANGVGKQDGWPLLTRQKSIQVVQTECMPIPSHVLPLPSPFSLHARSAAISPEMFARPQSLDSNTLSRWSR